MKARVYLDHAATSPILPQAAEAAEGALRGAWANPSSAHAEGRAARAVVDRAREELARFCGCLSEEVVFTSGATEANTLAVLGALASCGRPRAPLALSAVEHASLPLLAARLAREGRPVARLGVDRQGLFDLASLDQALSGPERAGAVSVMAANNETGTLLPAGEIAARCRRAGVLFHTDAVQAAGKIGEPIFSCGADLISLSARKLAGAPGTGVLLVRKGVSIFGAVGAGPQEKGLRGGTENVPGIAAFGAAARYWLEEGEAIRGRLAALGARLEKILASQEGAAVNCRESKRLPNIASARFAGIPGVAGVRGEALLQALDLEGIAVSVGAACSSGSLEPSAALLAMGYRPEEARGSVRFSLGWNSTSADLDALEAVLPAVLGRLRQTAFRHADGG